MAGLGVRRVLRAIREVILDPILIGEVAQRRRPGLGRGLMAISCLATASVVA
jgi:hypothetical protein